MSHDHSVDLLCKRLPTATAWYRQAGARAALASTGTIGRWSRRVVVVGSAATRPGSLVLVTGSEGRVGRDVTNALRRVGHAVRGLDILPATQPDDDHHEADLGDLPAIRVAMRGVDAVVHAAAIPTDRGDGAAVMATNVQGTYHVLRAALEAGVPRVVYFSSVNALGSVGPHRRTAYLPIDDGHPHHPMSPYQLSKHLAEELCRSFSERHGIVTLCLRPVWVTHPETYREAGFGTDAFMDRWRDELWAYVDIRDVCDAVLRCLAVEGVLHDRFLLAAADTSAHVETGDLVDATFADLPWPRSDRGRYLDSDPYRSLIDCGRAREVLAWDARHSWRDGWQGTDKDGRQVA
jgi:UDP-glucose 4-epimerase